MDRGACVGLVDGQLELLPSELVSAIGDPVWPGDEHLPPTGGAHDAGVIAVEKLAAAGRIRAQPAADLGDDHPLILECDLELLAGGPRGHRAPDPGSAMDAEFDRRPATTKDQAHIATATIAASA